MLSYRSAMIDDAEALNAALSQLSAELGDTHRADVAALRELGWGASPAFRAILAETDDEVVGAALYSPYVSTVFGSAGVYVSDRCGGRVWARGCSPPRFGTENRYGTRGS